MAGKKRMEARKGLTALVPVEADPGVGPHRVELDVRRRLLADPRLSFSSLVVRRLRDGVCLEGIVETDEAMDDLERLVGSISGVNTILNRLVQKRPERPPLKG